MQGAPARYVSASELYSTDEVELLLEEIRELEPTSCRGEDVADFEIAGSGCGAGAGGRSPAGTDLTERSWDSHAHYSRVPPPRPQPLAPVYCRPSYLLTSDGALTFLVTVVSLCACVCVWAGAGLRGAPPARALLFGALTSLMLHGLRLVLHVTRLHALLPLHWERLSGCGGAWSCGWLAAGALRLALQVPPLPPPAPALLYSAMGLGCFGAAGGALLTARALKRGCARRGGAGRGGRGSAASGAAYRAVPTAPPPNPPL
ncbi:uncharacterized protein LOC121737381 [Aricia agestis]|uniref:uncharacterized protein LOC121737381 n=1 Tax=Aricia agestis TaxID=91739 RepID=UPI001C202AE6|nr:uncharacterized protein LOC121737381 [Aricia agestis]